jgi:hypothetical protein
MQLLKAKKMPAADPDAYEKLFMQAGLMKSDPGCIGDGAGLTGRSRSGFA